MDANQWSLEKACDEANARLEKSWVERLDRLGADRSWFLVDVVDTETGETTSVEKTPGEWDRYAKQSTRETPVAEAHRRNPFDGD